MDIDAHKDTLFIAQLIRGKRKRCGRALGQNISAAFSVNVRIQLTKGQHGLEALLMTVICPADRHIHGRTAVLHLLHPLLQCFRIIGRDLNQCIHVIEFFAFPIHLFFDV